MSESILAATLFGVFNVTLAAFLGRQIANTISKYASVTGIDRLESLAVLFLRPFGNESKHLGHSIAVILSAISSFLLIGSSYMLGGYALSELTDSTITLQRMLDDRGRFGSNPSENFDLGLRSSYVGWLTAVTSLHFYGFIWLMRSNKSENPSDGYKVCPLCIGSVVLSCELCGTDRVVVENRCYKVLADRVEVYESGVSDPVEIKIRSTRQLFQITPRPFSTNLEVSLTVGAITAFILVNLWYLGVEFPGFYFLLGLIASFLVFILLSVTGFVIPKWRDRKPRSAVDE